MKKNAYSVIIVVSIIIFASLFIVYFDEIGYIIFTSQIKSVDSYDIELIIEDEFKSDVLILVGRLSCSSCIDIYKNIKTILDKTQVENIAYYDTDKSRQNSNFKKVGDYLNIDFIPSLVYIKEGKVVYTFSPIDLDIDNIDAIIDKLQ